MGEEATTAIEFPAQVTKIQTLADGGLRFTFDAPETAILPAAHLMECKRRGIAGNMTFEPIVDDDKRSGKHLRASKEADI